MQDDGIVLYHRFLDGDERGLEELIALYQRGLLRFIYGYVHDEGLAQDILQEVFIQLYFKRSFKEQKNASLKTYIYKIARNKSLNAIKKRKRKKEISLDLLTKKHAPAVENENGETANGDTFSSYLLRELSPEESLEKKQRELALHTAMCRLNSDYREVLELRYFEGLPPEKIAKITKKKPKQIYNLLARGRVALKEILISGEFDDENL
jgi:RNA polymerase sigma-70 factor (ECF subfamily)